MVRRPTLLSALTTGPLLLLATPAAAQEAPGDRVNIVVVYGDDVCPPSTENEIVVCPRLDEAERYRIPEGLRGDPDSPKRESWTNRATAYEYVGKSGINSCSPSEQSGMTGCLNQIIDLAYAEKNSAGALRAGQLIEEERARRLETVDADAAEQEAAVQAALDEQDRLRAEREAKAAGYTEDDIDEGEGDLPQP